jgi:hypothetical protein
MAVQGTCKSDGRSANTHKKNIPLETMYPSSHSNSRTIPSRWNAVEKQLLAYLIHEHGHWSKLIGAYWHEIQIRNPESVNAREFWSLKEQWKHLSKRSLSTQPHWDINSLANPVPDYQELAEQSLGFYLSY